MRIGYDAKRVFHNASGLGNYSRDLIRILGTHINKNDYFLYNPKPASLNKWKPLSNTIEKLPKGIWKWLHVFWRQGPIRNQLKRDRIQLFHGLSGELPKKLDIPSIVTVHDLIFLRYPKLYKKIDVNIHKRKVNHAVRSANKVVAISEQTKADIISYTGIENNKVEVIYQGCHPAFKKTLLDSEKKALKKKYNLPEKFVLYVGTLEERKNALLIAKSLLNTKHTIVFVGRVKAYGKKVKSFVEENGMANRVCFIDNIDVKDLAGIYQNATVFCYPSFFEGFGIPIIEALYSGVPVITTRGGCFSEAGGSSSLYINPNNEDELRDAVEQLSNESSKDRKNRIEQGQEFVQKFNDEVLAEQWNNLYEAVLS